MSTHPSIESVSSLSASGGGSIYSPTTNSDFLHLLIMTSRLTVSFSVSCAEAGQDLLADCPLPFEGALAVHTPARARKGSKKGALADNASDDDSRVGHAYCAVYKACRNAASARARCLPQTALLLLSSFCTT